MKSIIDIEKKYLDEEAQVIILFEMVDDDPDRVKITPVELKAIKKAKEDMAKGNFYTLEDLKHLISE